MSTAGMAPVMLMSVPEAGTVTSVTKHCQHQLAPRLGIQTSSGVPYRNRPTQPSIMSISWDRPGVQCRNCPARAL